MGASARRRTPSKGPRLSKAQRQELMALETRSHRTLTALDQSCEALRQLEDEIAHFMEQYYTKVGSYFEELARLEEELTAFNASIAADQIAARKTHQVNESLRAIAHKSNARALEADLKTLYRDMAKRAHPDAGDTADHEAMGRINEAYAKRNLGELWKIRQELEVEPVKALPKDRIAMLQAQQEALQKTLEEVESRRLSLEESEACALMQRAFQMRICGQDFIQQVTDQVLAQITVTRKKLVTTKIKHLYVDAQPARRDMAV